MKSRPARSSMGPITCFVYALFCLAPTFPTLADTHAKAATGNQPEQSACPAIRIAASGMGQHERALICDAAGKTRAFFRAHGIAIRQSIRIQTRDRAADPVLPHIGSYSLTDKAVRLLGLAQARHQLPSGTLFGLPLTEALYRSVVVHELAHAIANQHFHDNRPSLVAQEYIAYVAQLSTMEPATRDEILAANGLPPYRDIDEMSATYYAMDPSGFGIKVYRHFLSLDDPGGFIRGLLSGDIRPAHAENTLP